MNYDDDTAALHHQWELEQQEQMMTHNHEISTAIINKLARTLNSEIERNGEIKINNKLIWDGMLHKMSNEVWRGILESLKLLSEQHPRLFDFNHLAAIDRALQLLDRYEGYYDNVLDIKNAKMDNKKVAWKCLMTLREVYCAANNIYLPNSDASKITSTYGRIFE